MSGFNLSGIERIMVFGAHPDDEIIGPGGTMHHFYSSAKAVYVVTFTCGGTAANSPAEMEAMVARRKEEMKATDRILGVTKREVLGIPSQQVYNAVYGDNQLHHELIRLIRLYKPEILFTHSPDNHRDHNAISQITGESAFQASESILTHLGEPCPVPAIFCYSVEQELPCQNVVVEISRKDLDAKLEAMKTQVSQERKDYLQHFLDMIEARAVLWGSKLGTGKYAEPFYIGRAAPMAFRV